MYGKLALAVCKWSSTLLLRHRHNSGSCSRFKPYSLSTTAAGQGSLQPLACSRARPQWWDRSCEADVGL
jgi:hypothetical protein